jgi:hypothetical protein
MRVFKGKQFNRWATGEGISDADLCHAAAEAFAGQFDADLGGYLFKKRIARQDGGKSGGYRTILGFRKSDSKRIFFLYGFPKTVRANITSRERTALSANATSLVGATDQQIDVLKVKGTILEMECRI